ncbi:MAG TPA: hypothetical protein VFF76_07435 [Holophagaceae bacterium]|jgi:hypothetical protein|nr:hypothetical protein [Holophagaceae bacterium]
MGDLFSMRISRLRFFGLGLGLSVLKMFLDWGVFRLFGQFWSPLIYIHPTQAPLFHPAVSGGWGLWFALWAIAAPFLLTGAWLTLRRLRDAALPPGLVVFFFVPFANLLFFLVMSLVPGRDAGQGGAAEAPPGPVSSATAFWVAATGGAVVFLGLMAVSIGLLGAYGITLFLGAPFLSGLAAARLLARLGPGSRPALRAISAALIAATLATAVMIAFALEGLVCILMASPIVILLASLGALIGSLTYRPIRPLAAGCSAALPLLLLLDGRTGEPDIRVVTSDVVIAAQPEAVWDQVIAFPPLPPAKEWLFRAGVAAPLKADIDGAGAGAVRHCVFSTGAFVEPVTVWSPGRELSFSVAAQPDVLRELTLWAGPRPPHLDDYLQCVKGQFILEPLPGGRTHLVGRTWYRLRMAPEPYWGLWSDAFIHRIHMRVLNHVAMKSEKSHA